MLTQKLACDLLTTALEGGSNYWLEHNQPGLAGYTLVENYIPEKMWGVIDDEGDKLTLTWGQMQLALTQMPLWHLDNLKNDNWDAETADVWLQCALFGGR